MKILLPTQMEKIEKNNQDPEKKNRILPSTLKKIKLLLGRK
jgi:hypothetical protein